MSTTTCPRTWSSMISDAYAIICSYYGRSISRYRLIRSKVLKDDWFKTVFRGGRFGLCHYLLPLSFFQTGALCGRPLSHLRQQRIQSFDRPLGFEYFWLASLPRQVPQVTGAITSLHYPLYTYHHLSPFSGNSLCFFKMLVVFRENCLVGSLRQILWWKWCCTRNAGSRVFWLFQATWQRQWCPGETAMFRDGSDSSMRKPLTEVFLAWFTIFGMGQQGIFSTWARKLQVPQSFKRPGVCLLRRKRAGSDTKLARLQATFGLSCLPRLVHHHWDCRRPPTAEIECIPFLSPWASHMHSGVFFARSNDSICSLQYSLQIISNLYSSCLPYPSRLKSSQLIIEE